MAAQAPREGLEFVPGTMEEVGVELLKHVKDPQDVIAYGGYGFWAPKGAIGKVKGASKQDLTNAPIAPYTAPYVADDEYESREVDEFGQPVKADEDSTEADVEANAPIEDVGVDEKAVDESKTSESDRAEAPQKRTRTAVPEQKKPDTDKSDDSK